MPRKARQRSEDVTLAGRDSDLTFADLQLPADLVKGLSLSG